MAKTLLNIQDLKISVYNKGGYQELIKGLNLSIEEFQIVSLVGTSGSGKTTIGLSILGLLPSAMAITGGKIVFNGENLLDFSPSRLRLLRGKEIGMVFQEPLSAFNPVFTIGFQIEEVLKFHMKLNRQKRKERIYELLELAGIPEPQRVAHQYPHQLSGGMRQRAMIAQVIATQPKLIIADEPTSNLDVTLQALMIELFQKLKEELKISILLITHDLGVVNALADNMIVLSDGRTVESGKTKEILASPKHPFTCELVEAVLA